jgi:hypothetical protein
MLRYATVLRGWRGCENSGFQAGSEKAEKRLLNANTHVTFEMPSPASPGGSWLAFPARRTGCGRRCGWRISGLPTRAASAIDPTSSLLNRWLARRLLCFRSRISAHGLPCPMLGRPWEARRCKPALQGLVLGGPRNARFGRDTWRSRARKTGVAGGRRPKRSPAANSTSHRSRAPKIQKPARCLDTPSDRNSVMDGYR